MKIAVVGGTGSVGRPVVQEVTRVGHEPVVLSRATGVDLLTGAGLDAAPAGAVVVRRKMPADQRIVPVAVNGGPGFAVMSGGTTRFVCSSTLHRGRTARVDIVAAPDKLPSGGVRESAAARG